MDEHRSVSRNVEIRAEAVRDVSRRSHESLDGGRREIFRRLSSKQRARKSTQDECRENGDSELFAGASVCRWRLALCDAIELVADIADVPPPLAHVLGQASCEKLAEDTALHCWR